MRQMYLKFERDWGWNLARLLAYVLIEALFATLGLELIVVALVARTMRPSQEQMLIERIIELLPNRIERSTVMSFTNSLRTAPVLVLLGALPIALWYGSRFFVVLESALCVVFRRRQRQFVHQNAVAMGMILLFAVVLPIILLSAAVDPGPEVYAPVGYASVHATQLSDDVVSIALHVAASLAANFFLLLIAFTLVTPGRVRLRAAWPGALVAACLIQIYLLIFPIYSSTILRPDRFGTLAGFVLVITVFFVAYALCVVIGAELASWIVGYRAASKDIASTLAEARVVEVRHTPVVEREPEREPESTLAA